MFIGLGALGGLIVVLLIGTAIYYIYKCCIGESEDFKEAQDEFGRINEKSVQDDLEDGYGRVSEKAVQGPKGDGYERVDGKAVQDDIENKLE